MCELKQAILAPPRGFTNAEYAARLHTVQSKMHAQKLACLWLTTEADICYCTGFLSQFWQSPTRPWFVVVPIDGKPIAVIPEIGASCMHNGWMEDIRCWSSPHPSDDGISLLIEALHEVVASAVAAHGQAYARVGVSQGRETHVRMPMADFHKVTAALAPTSISDATAVLRTTRMTKSEAEIDKIRFVAQTVSGVFEDLFDFVDVGMADDTVFRMFKIACLNAGIDDVAYLVGAAGRGGYDDIISPPRGRIISDGDILILDTGATYDGYFCDFDRNYGFGQIDEASKRAYAAVWHATEAGLAAAQPGRRCSDVFSAMHAVLSAAGAMGDNVGRYGHGLGIQLTEPPSHTAWDNTVLQPGMVVTLEPGMVFAPGKMMVHEENMVVRDGGPELLSRRAAHALPIKS